MVILKPLCRARYRHDNKLLLRSGTCKTLVNSIPLFFFFVFFWINGIYFKIDLLGGLNHSRYFTCTCSKYPPRTLTSSSTTHSTRTLQIYMYVNIKYNYLLPAEANGKNESERKMKKKNIEQNRI
jgi:hypothetical protein